MRVAVLGCGSIGQRHLRTLQALGCDVGAFDVIPRSGTGVRCVGAFVSSHWDAVVIATPYDTHLQYVERAIHAGTPFFVEKPLGSLEQMPRWRILAARSDLPVHQVGYMLRFHPRYRALRQLIPHPTQGQFTCHFDRSTWPGKSYGPAALEASHELDLALDCGLRSGAVELMADAPYFRAWNLSDARTTASVTFPNASELGEQMYHDEVAHFLDRVQGRADLGVACDLPQAVRVLATCQRVPLRHRISV
jgi:predicted dehydrogenase